MIKYFLFILFTATIFSTTLECMYNNKPKKFKIQENSLNILEKKNNQTIKYVVHDIKNLNPVDDYVEISNKKYKIIYPLNCIISQ